MKPIKTCWCGSIAEGNTELCATHNHEARRNERAAAKVKVVRQVMKVTAKRAGELQEYSKLRAEYLALYPVCEVPECNLKAVDVHHEAGRENGRLLDVKRFRGICRKHHDYYTEHSKKQKRKEFHSHEQLTQRKYEDSSRDFTSKNKSLRK